MSDNPFQDGFDKSTSCVATILAYILTPFVILFGILFLIQEITGLKALDWFLNLLN